MYDIDAAEGNLSTVTDTEWRAAHEALAGLLVDRQGVPVLSQFPYVWDPDGARGDAG